MAGRPHILLIGIDAYDGDPKFSLNGCVNDIDAVQRLLVDRVGVALGNIARLASPRSRIPHETDVPETSPTLDALKSAFARLGADGVVAPEDSVFIYYSGHGTQVVAQDKHGQRFSREALVPKDREKFTKKRFLYDWELNELIGRIAQRTSAVTVVLDCCCSAGAMRSVMLGDTSRGLALSTAPRARFWGTPGVVEMDEDVVPPKDRVRGVTTGLARVGSCNIVAACLDTERARESVGQDARAQGELSRALVRQLSSLPQADLADVRWGRIWRAILEDVKAANRWQSPWMSGSFARRVFGGGADELADPGFGVRLEGAGYHVDAGTLSGVTADAEVTVYGVAPPLFPLLGTLEEVAARKGRIRVTHADRSASIAVAVAPFDFPMAARGRLTRAGRDAALRLALSPEDPTLVAELRASPFIELVAPGAEEATLERRTDGAWALTDDVQGNGEDPAQPVLAVIPADSLAVARRVVEHYHKYIAPVRMAVASVDLPRAISIWLLDCNGSTLSAAEAQEPDLPQLAPGQDAPYGVAVGDSICFVLENHADVALSVSLIDCGVSGRVAVIGEKRMPPRSRHVVWYEDTLGVPFEAWLPTTVDVGLDRIVAIGTTRGDISLKYLETATAFADLIHPRRTHAGTLRGRAADVTPPEQWTSAMTAVRIERRGPTPTRR